MYLLKIIGKMQCFWTTQRMNLIFINFFFLFIFRNSGTMAEDALHDSNPIFSQAVIKGELLLVDKLISTKYECFSSILLVAACSLKEIGQFWLSWLPLWWVVLKILPNKYWYFTGSHTVYCWVLSNISHFAKNLNITSLERWNTKLDTHLAWIVCRLNESNKHTPEYFQ